MKFKKILSLNYNKELFTLFLTAEKKYIILKNYENLYTYPTTEEFSYIYHFLYKKNYVNKVELKKFIPKVIFKGTAITLSAATIFLLYMNKKINDDYQDFLERSQNVYIEETVDITDVSAAEYFEIEDEDNLTAVEVKTIYESDLLKYKIIFDFDYIDELFEQESVSISEFQTVINNNSDIADNLKPYVLEYVTNSYAETPDLDLRILYENLKTIKIIEADESTIMFEALSTNAVAVYLKNTNTIYVNENNDYENDSWSYQVLMHELTHVAKYYDTVYNDYSVQVKTSYDYNFNIILEEALVSYYAVQIYDKNELNIAYQLQSNYISILIDCMDNYELRNIVEKDITYFLSQLDSYNNQEGMSVYIFELINAQYQDFYDDQITISQDQFYEIYDYIAKMYFDKYINDNTTYEEATVILNELIYKLTYDVPDEYNIDTNHFKEYFETYYQNLSENSQSYTM